MPNLWQRLKTDWTERWASRAPAAVRGPEGEQGLRDPLKAGLMECSTWQQGDSPRSSPCWKIPSTLEHRSPGLCLTGQVQAISSTACFGVSGEIFSQPVHQGIGTKQVW